MLYRLKERIPYNNTTDKTSKPIYQLYNYIIKFRVKPLHYCLPLQSVLYGNILYMMGS